MKKIKRIQTHIDGFDKLVQGGFPKGSNILLNGAAGTGKTIFSIEFLYNGALNNKEKGIYFTFEEKKNSLFDQAIQFGWDLEKLEKSGKLKVISIGTEDISSDTVSDMLEIIKNSKTKRVVIDSITTLSFLTPENSINGQVSENSVKKFLYTFLTKFKELEDLTVLVISQKDEVVVRALSEYICDGVINIEYESLGGDFSRNLTIKKMRKTKNDEDLHPLEISPKGIVIHDLD